MTAAEEFALAQQHSKRFTVLHEMYCVRRFRLVLCADVFARAEERAVEMLKRIRAVEAGKNCLGSDLFLHRTLVISDRRSPRIRFHGTSAGDPPRCSIYASAL
jgi:hypothetical protein